MQMTDLTISIHDDLSRDAVVQSLNELGYRTGQHGD